MLGSDGIGVEQEALGRIADVADLGVGRRTRTQLDDVLTRTVGRLSSMWGAALALIVYVVFGVLVPVVFDLGRAGLITFGLLGALWGVVVLPAALLCSAGHASAPSGRVDLGPDEARRDRVRVAGR